MEPVSFHCILLSRSFFFSTVTYSVKVYGPQTEAENIRSVNIGIEGKDGAHTEIKYLTDRTTVVQGYDTYLI